MVATFITTQRTNVETFSTDVTPEQIGKCFKVYDETSKQWFYQVDNDSDKFDSDGNLITYKVQWTKDHGFTCSCPSGQNGFANVKHPSGTCKHVRWSAAASREEHAATAIANREHSLLIDNKPATQERYEAIVKAPVKKSHGNAKSYQPKPFSLLK